MVEEKKVTYLLTYGGKIHFFQFQYHQTLKYLYPFLDLIINFYAL